MKKIGGGFLSVWLFSLVSAVIFFVPILYLTFTSISKIDLLDLLFMGGSALLHLFYYLILQKGYQSGELSIVYPTARACGPLLAMVIAIVFLGESIFLQTFVGGILIISGVFFLSGGFRKKSKNTSFSLGMGLAAGIFIGIYTAWDAYAVSVLGVSPFLMEYLTCIFCLLTLTPRALKNREAAKILWKNHKYSILCIAIFNPLAYILVLISMISTPVVYVAPLREMSVILTVIMGSLLLKEGQIRRRTFWSVIIFGGVLLLATS